MDGVALKCKLSDPRKICVEFENVVYLVDYKTSSVKLFSTMKRTAKFLNALGSLFAAFQTHEKGIKLAPKNLQGAISLESQCNNTMEDTLMFRINRGRHLLFWGF